MSALVVYESLFGDAKRIAEAVADGLSQTLPAHAVDAAAAPSEMGEDVRLLVVGGPNHAMSMPRPSTRRSAVDQHGATVVDTTRGLHEWLDALRLPAGTRAAAFDTRMDHPTLVVKLDHASRTEEKLLKRHGATIAAPAEHFQVTDAKGPLADGEEERARRWGQALAEQLTRG
jgi:flavodoxin